MSDRRRLLAKVHIAKKDLGIPDEFYRSLLFERYGVRSARDLSERDLVDLCRHFEKLGWEPKPPRNLPKAAESRKPLLKKIFAICFELGLPVPEYPAGIAKRMFGVDYIGWCTPDQLQKIVAALVYHKKRKEGCDAIRKTNVCAQ